MAKKKIRHVMGLSGGKDSTALAILLSQHPDYADIEVEYFFCDTHKELSETYDYLDRIEARLGIKITRLQAERVRSLVGRIRWRATVSADTLVH